MKLRLRTVQPGIVLPGEQVLCYADRDIRRLNNPKAIVLMPCILELEENGTWARVPFVRDYSEPRSN